MEKQYDRSIRPILDAYDDIRELLKDLKKIELPKIVVVGDQSSGKSSVLESITGINLPRGENTVTKCPIVIKLRGVNKEEDEFAKVRIEGDDESLADKIRLDQLEKIIREKQEQVIFAAKKEIVNKPIYVNIHKLNAPDLTLYDLPGMTYKKSEVTQEIRNIITHYTKEEQTLILLVLAANNDLTNSEAIELIKKNENYRDRTIAIITKIDLVLDKEKNFAKKIIDNELELAYKPIIVRNRTTKELESNVPAEEIRRIEKDLIENNDDLNEIDEDCKGTESLVVKLVSLQKLKLQSSKYDVKQNIVEEIGSCKEKLLKLPAPADSITEKSDRFKECLNNLLTKYKKIVNGFNHHKFSSNINSNISSNSNTNNNNLNNNTNNSNTLSTNSNSNTNYISPFNRLGTQKPTNNFYLDENSLFQSNTINNQPQKIDNTNVIFKGKESFAVSYRNCFASFFSKYDSNKFYFLKKEFRSKVQISISESRGFRLPNLHDPQAIHELIKEEIVKSEKHVDILIRQCKELTKEVLYELVDEFFFSYPQLLKAVKDEIKNLLDRQSINCTFILGELLDAEKLGEWTINPYYMDLFNKIIARIALKKEEIRSLGNNLNMNKNVYQELTYTPLKEKETIEINDIEIDTSILFSKDNLNANSDYDNSTLNFQIICFSYWNVLFKRFVDYTHLMILKCLVYFFETDLGLHLDKKFSPSNDKCNIDLIFEDLSIATKRNKLKNDIINLEKALEKLNRAF